MKRLDGNYSHLRRFSRALLAVALVGFIVHLSAVNVLIDKPDYPGRIVMVSLLTIAVVQTVVFTAGRRSWQHVPARMRRHIYFVWNANSLASLLAALAIWWNCPPDHPELLLLVFPLLMAVVAVT